MGRQKHSKAARGKLPIGDRGKRSPQNLYLDAQDAMCKDKGWTPRVAAMMQTAFVAAIESGRPLPAEMADELLSAFREVAAGVQAPLFTPSKSPGHREDPFAKVLIGYAVGYLEAVDQGRLEDAAPIRTVATAFDCTERTVRGWRQRYTPRMFAGSMTKQTLESIGKRYRAILKKRIRPY